MRKCVIVESPFAGDVERNLRYLRACLRDSLMRGEAPFASHGLYTQPGVLNDRIPEERLQGIHAGFSWHRHAARVVVYTDLGISDGMHKGIRNSEALHVPLEYRTLGGEWSQA